MLATIISSVIGLLSFGLLDYVWLAHIAKNFYLDALSTHVTIKEGSLVPYIPAVPLVYIIAIVSILFFVLPRTSTLGHAVLYGAILGFCLYGFYDMTNLATLKDYTWKLALVDMIWGTFAVGVVSGIIFYTKELLS